MDTARRGEAMRLLGIAQNLLQNKDFTGARDFAILSQETDPLLDGADQILAVADVLRASDNRVSNRNLDWYGILQVDKRSEDLELIRKQYRRLALLLHPDKNQLPWADSAFRLVSEAWTVLSDSAKKSVFDGFFARVDLLPVDNNQRAYGFQQFRRQEDNLPPQPPPPQPQPQPAPPQVRQPAPAPELVAPPVRSPAAPSPAAAGSSSRGGANFWTMCPYCYNLYQYPKIYIDCCLRCQNCERAFHAAEIENLPPAVPGKDAYYCYWGFFPIGFSAGVVKEPPPPPVKKPPRNVPVANGEDGFVPASAEKVTPKPGAKKRGRPKKNPSPST